MIELTIARGFLIITDENGQIYPGWLGEDAPAVPEDLPEPSFVYDKCMAAGLSPERTIDIMLEMFHTERFIRKGFLADYDIILGLVGPRGGGKSCGGSAISIYDFLLCHVPVFSNMDIAVKVKYKQASKVFKSTSLDKTSLLNVRDQDNMYRNCCLFVDEANLEVAETQRTSGNKALWFSYALQQARKRHLCMIHTEQNEYHVTERLRWQTNIFISCKDAAYEGGAPQMGDRGRKSRWKVYDYSGVFSGETFDGSPIYEPLFHNTPFWHSFDTEQIQTGETELPDFKKHGDVSIQPGDGLKALREKYAVATAIIDEYSQGDKKTEVFCDLLWENMGIANKHGEQVRIGKQLAGLGIPCKQETGGRRYYIFPRGSALGGNGDE